MRRLAPLFATLALATIFVVPMVGFAQTYQLLAPLGNNISETPTATEYIVGAFRLGIGIAAGLAVIAIAWGGLQWMLSDVVTNKTQAISTIKNALLGLLLALASYLILQTISPALTDLGINEVTKTP